MLLPFTSVGHIRFDREIHPRHVIVLWQFFFATETTGPCSSITEGPSTKGSNKKLLILDLNGVVMANALGRRTRNRDFNFRPHCFAFLQFCFSYFDVAVWSSKQRHNIEPVLESLSTLLKQNIKDKLIFVWDQSRCIVAKTRLKENADKKVMFKELKSVWADYRSYNSSNTILVDDSPYKSFINSISIPDHPIAFGTYASIPVQMKLIHPEGGFVKYLKKLADTQNVQ
ncbi:unnamed protein product [Coffea canephora]|uniref:Mitochondrial import inner membrane translocase subunit TIM50 n=1 Tax=Coffea canephora TaxID=49390 RepID=A0A068UIU9_COFCA|nr:unnamed protein product [Coffea canephora]